MTDPTRIPVIMKIWGSIGNEPPRLLGQREISSRHAVVPEGASLMRAVADCWEAGTELAAEPQEIQTPSPRPRRVRQGESIVASSDRTLKGFPGDTLAGNPTNPEKKP